MTFTHDPRWLGAVLLLCSACSSSSSSSNPQIPANELDASSEPSTDASVPDAGPGEARMNGTITLSGTLAAPGATPSAFSMVKQIDSVPWLKNSAPACGAAGLTATYKQNEMQLNIAVCDATVQAQLGVLIPFAAGTYPAKNPTYPTTQALLGWVAAPGPYIDYGSLKTSVGGILEVSELTDLVPPSTSGWTIGHAHVHYVGTLSRGTTCTTVSCPSGGADVKVEVDLVISNVKSAN